MKRALISLSALSIATLPALAETQDFQVDSFSSIDVNGGIKVLYEPGAETSVIVEQAEGDFSDISIKSDDGELQISRESLGFLKSLRANLNVDLVDGDLRVKVNGKRKPSYTVNWTWRNPQFSKPPGSMRGKSNWTHLRAVN